MRMMLDSQQALSFMVQQATHLETEVYRVQYPDIQYPALIPVDTSANEWAKSVTYFSMDKVGQAGWFNHLAKDIPIADIQKTKFEHGIEMAGIGYRYTMEELGAAMLVPGTNLTSERAEAARRAYEEFVDDAALRGKTDKNWTGLINDPNVTVIHAQADGGQALGDTDGSPDWRQKDADQILRDVNEAISGVYAASLQIEMADTVLVPVASWNILTTKRIPNTTMNLMAYLQQYNAYTAVTGQPLTIRAVRGLESAGTGGTGRMVLYKKDPRVLKLHLPMPHRFLPVWQTGPIIFDVPGIFRLGGVEIRRPGSVRYVDYIIDAEYQ